MRWLQYPGLHVRVGLKEVKMGQDMPVGLTVFREQGLG